MNKRGLFLGALLLLSVGTTFGSEGRREIFQPVVLDGTASDITGRWKGLKIGSGRQWSYIGKPWKDGANGLIKPPPYPWNVRAAAYTGQESNNDEILQAFHTGQAYGDFEAEFRFRWDGAHCGCGIIFRFFISTSSP